MMCFKNQSYRWILGTSLSLFAFTGSNCKSGTNTPPVTQPTEKFYERSTLNWDHTAEQITTQCKDVITQTNKKLNFIVATPPQARNFDNTVLAFENIMADLSDASGVLTFYGYVSTDPGIREASSNCESELSEYSVGILTRKDIYQAIKGVQPSVDPKHPHYALDARLIAETKKGFERNGLNLSDEKLTELRELKQKLARLESEFAKNLNEDTSSVTFTAEELVGVPESTLTRLKKTTDGKYIVTTKSTDYAQTMDNAANPETRKKILFAYENRAANKNTDLLKKALQTRHKIAVLMGYSNWADFQISEKMAKTSETVNQFLNSLTEKLSLKNQADLARLLEIKKSTDASATQLNAWDIRYFTNEVKKKDFQLDEEKVREYFPADHVVRGMFDVYSKLLGVRYEEIKDAAVWSSDVKKYSVIDKSNNQPIAVFYADFYPRAGKYGHAAAFTLQQGRKTAQGYAMPVSSIVSNFNPPSNGKPSLLSHSEVETLFHEFGHIMHQVLTRARYASMAGTSVARDLVEAPSQMLENWVWDASVLASVSGHYRDVTQKLPQEMLTQLLAAKQLNVGYTYTRQLVFGTFDMALHNSANESIDPNQLYADIHQRLVGFAPVEGSSFAAGFGHLMGGYDAGYYGYLWSEVYAADMFSIFEKNGLLDEATGMRYRRSILEKGSTIDPFDLLEEFLGRKPNNEAFFKQLGI